MEQNHRHYVVLTRGIYDGSMRGAISADGRGRSRLAGRHGFRPVSLSYGRRLAIEVGASQDIVSVGYWLDGGRCDWAEIQTTTQTYRDDFDYTRDFSTQGVVGFYPQRNLGRRDLERN